MLDLIEPVTCLLASDLSVNHYFFWGSHDLLSLLPAAMLAGNRCERTVIDECFVDVLNEEFEQCRLLLQNTFKRMGASMKNLSLKRFSDFAHTCVAGVLVLSWFVGSVVEAQDLARAGPIHFLPTCFLQTSVLDLIFLIPALTLVVAASKSVLFIGSNPRETSRAIGKAIRIGLPIAGGFAAVAIFCILVVALGLWLVLIMLTGDPWWFLNGLPSAAACKASGNLLPSSTL